MLRLYARNTGSTMFLLLLFFSSHSQQLQICSLSNVKLGKNSRKSEFHDFKRSNLRLVVGLVFATVTRHDYELTKFGNDDKSQ